MDKYIIQTTSDSGYFPFLKIFINSILTNCDKKYLHKIYIVNTGMDEEQINYILSLSNVIEIINTGINTDFRGGTWGEDWQINVKGKTKWLLQTILNSQYPVLMLDSDMLIVKDIYDLLTKGGDVQVCKRSNPSVPYIGSYFFSINKEKGIQFLKRWIEIIESTNGKRPLESPALCKTVLNFESLIKIKEIDESLVNAISPSDFIPETYIVHFKGQSLDNNVSDSFYKRTIGRGWENLINNYLKNV
jgi:hypothetical protein